MIRRAGSLPKAEIARTTKLSAQTVSVIINRLLRAKLLRKEPPQREKGKVGQPAVPIALNPTGAYSIGVKIGRRSLEVLVIDFVGRAIERIGHRYNYPDPDRVFPIIEQDIATVTKKLSATQRERIVGIGVAAPYGLGGWQQEFGAPKRVMARWHKIDIHQRVAAGQDLPVWFSNDATAAAIAELEFGNTASFHHFLYVFVGTFVGGGVVLNGTLHTGPFDNAGAIGSMPVPAHYANDKNAEDHARGGVAPVQLIRCASLYLLEDRLRHQRLDPGHVIDAISRGDDDELPRTALTLFEDWLRQAAAAIACAITGAISVLDFEGIVIDGALPANLVARLTDAVDEALNRMNLEGLTHPQLRAGTIGNDARVLGGAILPFYANFAPDRDVLLNVGADTIR